MSQSSRVRRGFRALSLLGVIALILTIGVAPVLTSGADHLDAPSLGSISVNPDDTLNVSKVRGPLDINDVYAFRGSSASRTVLAMTVNPAINVLGPTTFQQRAKYFLNVDTGTDAVARRAHQDDLQPARRRWHPALHRQAQWPHGGHRPHRRLHGQGVERQSA